MRAWFPDDEACRDYLEWLRWPTGFECTRCGAIGTACRLADLSWWCPACDTRTSVTAGTIFHRTRTPLTVWFAAAWFLTSQKDGASALGLQRVLGLGSYQTAWAMLHRLRSAMARPGRDRLSGVVEMDETLLGGVRPGGKGGRTPGEKILVGVAIERRKPRGFGRCRLAVLPDASTESLAAFLAAYVEPVRLSLPTAGSPTRAPSQTSTATSATSRPVGSPMSSSPACTVWPACSIDGCSPPIRALSKEITSRRTWTSSASGSTVATPAAEGSSFGGSSNNLSTPARELTHSSS